MVASGRSPDESVVGEGGKEGQSKQRDARHYGYAVGQAA